MLQKTVGSLKMCKSSAATLEGTRNFAIKLFGATICVPVSYEENGYRKRPTASMETSKIAQSSSEVENLTDMRAKLLKKSETTSEISCNIDKGVKSEEKSPQKPEKPVSCPRCHSVETKFCYFNNYNVNQPRHFCKNCRRYWTAGGTMRNIPVGAGRRKSKHFSAFQLSKSVDLQERKAKAENFEQSVQLTPVFDQTAVPETKNLPLPCLEKFDGVNSVEFFSPLAMDASEVPSITGFANLLDPGSKLDGMSLENNPTRWIPTIQQSGNSNILNCLVLSGRPLGANFPTK